MPLKSPRKSVGVCMSSVCTRSRKAATKCIRSVSATRVCSGAYTEKSSNPSGRPRLGARRTACSRRKAFSRRHAAPFGRTFCSATSAEAKKPTPQERPHEPSCVGAEGRP